MYMKASTYRWSVQSLSLYSSQFVSQSVSLLWFTSFSKILLLLSLPSTLDDIWKKKKKTLRKSEPLFVSVKPKHSWWMSSLFPWAKNICCSKYVRGPVKGEWLPQNYTKKVEYGIWMLVSSWLQGIVTSFLWVWTEQSIIKVSYDAHFSLWKQMVSSIWEHWTVYPPRDFCKIREDKK